MTGDRIARSIPGSGEPGLLGGHIDARTERFM